jgi:spermidine/putrescine transport system permease protein
MTVILGLVYGYIPYMILPLFAGLDRIEVSLLEAAKDLGASPFRAFLRVTLPMSKQAILAGMVIVTLPMFGDYFTNNLLSGAPNTSMIGNIIDGSIGTPGQGANAAVLVLLVMLILIVPMLYYVYSTGKATNERRA